MHVLTWRDALENIAFSQFSAGVRLYRFVMCYRDTPKKNRTAVQSRRPVSTRGDAEKRPQSIGDRQASDGVQRADLFTVALLGIARCGKTRSTGPLLRDDAAGQQQQRDDEQGAGHAGRSVVLHDSACRNIASTETASPVSLAT